MSSENKKRYLKRPTVEPDPETEKGSSKIVEPRDKSQDADQESGGSSSASAQAAVTTEVPRKLVPLGRLQRAVCGEGGNSYKLMSPVVKWRGSDIPVKVHISTLNCPIDRDTYKMTIRNVIKTFEVLYGLPFFQVVDNSSTAKVRVGWKGLDGSGRTVAVTSYSWGSGGWLTKSNLDFDTSEKWTHRLTETCGAAGNAFDCWNVAMHEFLHVIGLDHVSDQFSSLYPSVKFGETLRRDPNPGDKEGFWALYGQVAAPAPAPAPTPTPTPAPQPSAQEIDAAVKHLQDAMNLLT